MTVADDLATLLNRPDLSRREREACRDRVVAEIARLNEDAEEHSAALAAAEAAVKKQERHVDELLGRIARLERRLAEADERKQELWTRLLAAEDEAAWLRDGLRWYAERRNYVPAAPPAVPPPKHLMDTDAWDGGGPGARARALLAEDGAAKDLEGDPVVVHPPDPLAGSQAGLNGPSGSPTSPSKRDTEDGAAHVMRGGAMRSKSPAPGQDGAA